MRCHLLIPHLGLPGCQRDPLPNLDTLLAKAGRTPIESVSFEEWLCRNFGIEGCPIASLSAGKSGFFLRADPAFLRLQRNQFVLQHPGEISQEEANLLLNSLNLHFSGEGFVFSSPSPDSWLLELPSFPDIQTVSFHEALGKSVDPLLPKGNMKWPALFNEIQMILFEHPVNEERENKGKLPINSLWLWGEGPMPQAGPSNFSSVSSNNFLAGNIARGSGAAFFNLPENAASWLQSIEAGENLAVLDNLRIPALTGDFGSRENSLRALEKNWFGPLHLALKKKEIDALVVTALNEENSLRYEVGPLDLWKFWRT